MLSCGLWVLYCLLNRLAHFLLIHFGMETTALVVTAQRCDKEGNVYLQGQYIFMDANGHNHTFAFTICTDWPGDEQWRKLMQFYAQGARNRVRYLQWWPNLHEIQVPA